MHDVPWPADFGGVVDLFYKLKWLHAAGLKIHLHCFLNKRPPQEILNNYCEKVHYYKRQKLSAFSLSIPFIVNSRKSDGLLTNLQRDNYPILFEGIHCTYYLYKNKLERRKVFIRLHNVEYRYYEQLAKHESNFLKKIYFEHEAKLLKKYENAIANKGQILTVSTDDAELYKSEFAAKEISFLPVFLPYNYVSSLEGKGKYCLYHGNLSINENETAAIWLLEKLFQTLQIPLIIAGKNPSKKLLSIASKNRYISIVANPSEINMQLLIANAQINILPSFNNTGVKLKLLNALFNGRYCLVNNAAVEGSTLNNLCTIANKEAEFKEKILVLYNQPFTQKEMQHRSTALKKLYNNRETALLLIDMIQ